MSVGVCVTTAQDLNMLHDIEFIGLLVIYLVLEFLKASGRPCPRAEVAYFIIAMIVIITWVC